MRVIPPSYEILTNLDAQSMATRIESCGRICYKSEDKITEDSAGPFISNILKRKHNSVAEMAVITLKMTFDGVMEGITSFFRVIPRYFSVDQISENILLVTGSVRAFRDLYMFNPEVEPVQSVTAFLNAGYPLFFSDLIPKGGLEVCSGHTVERVSLAEVEKMPSEIFARHRHIAVKFITNRAVTHEIVRHRPCAYLQESQRYCRYDKQQFGNEVTFIKPVFFSEESEEYEKWQQAMTQTEEIYLDLLKTSSPQAARTVLPNSCKTEIIVFTSLSQWHHIFNLRTPPAAEPSMRELMIPLRADFTEMYPSVFGNK